MVTKNFDLQGKNIVTLEDDKYKYKFLTKTSQLSAIIVKNYSAYAKQGDEKSQAQVENVAKSYLIKYGDFTDINMVLTSYSHRIDAVGNVHDFIFDGQASNGIITGDCANVVANNNGELLYIFRTIGNKALAESYSPKLSEDKVTDIAIQNIKDKYPVYSQFENKDAYNKEYSVKIVDNKPVAIIRMKGFKTAGNEYGFVFHIDTDTGEVLYDDYYNVSFTVN